MWLSLHAPSNPALRPVLKYKIMQTIEHVSILFFFKFLSSDKAIKMFYAFNSKMYVTIAH